jgi:hypothetical protein
MKERLMFTPLALCFWALLFTACPPGVENAPELPQQAGGGEETPGEDKGPPPFTGLEGTVWLWGQSALEFRGAAAVFRQDESQPYPWELDAPLAEGAAGSGSIAALGRFTIDPSRETLALAAYRSRGAAAVADAGGNSHPYPGAVFKRKNPGALVIPNNTVTGTEWNVGYQSDSVERFAPCQWIIFFTGDLALNQSGGGVFQDAYTYNPETQKGWIEFINNFQIQDNGNRLYIPSYKQYGHGMICYRVR